MRTFSLPIRCKTLKTIVAYITFSAPFIDYSFLFCFLLVIRSSVLFLPQLCISFNSTIFFVAHVIIKVIFSWASRIGTYNYIEPLKSFMRRWNLETLLNVDWPINVCVEYICRHIGNWMIWPQNRQKPWGNLPNRLVACLKIQNRKVYRTRLHMVFPFHMKKYFEESGIDLARHRLPWWGDTWQLQFDWLTHDRNPLQRGEWLNVMKIKM